MTYVSTPHVGVQSILTLNPVAIFAIVVVVKTTHPFEAVTVEEL